MKHRIPFVQARLAYSILLCVLASLILSGVSRAQSDNTTRHTIVKGDTLWSLSATYLEKPWLWPELWEQNTHIENPHLIYPDDVLLISPGSIRLIRNKRLTVNKLSPQIRSEPSHAITTIEPSVIMPFLSQSIVVEPAVLENAAYVLQGVDDKIILGKNSRIYAKGLASSKATEYLIFNAGRTIEDEYTGTQYGVEGVHLGLARLIRHEGDVSELEIIKANQDVRPGDRLMPIEKPVELPHYFPRRPNTLIDARIISIPKGLDEVGRRDVVIISGGRAQGLEEGHVLEVFSYKGEIKDPVTGKMIKLPDDKVAIAMVFKPFENVSYALLVETSASVKVGDRALSP